ncbi:hypothetical protein Psyaliredsea_01700 [Psychrobacter alimentarius]
MAKLNVRIAYEFASHYLCKTEFLMTNYLVCLALKKIAVYDDIQRMILDIHYINV